MSRLGAQQNGTFRGWYEMPKNDAAPVCVNGSNRIRPFDQEGSITSTS